MNLEPSGFEFIPEKLGFDTVADNTIIGIVEEIQPSVTR